MRSVHPCILHFVVIRFLEGSGVVFPEETPPSLPGRVVAGVGVHEVVGGVCARPRKPQASPTAVCRHPYMVVVAAGEPGEGAAVPVRLSRGSSVSLHKMLWDEGRLVVSEGSRLSSVLRRALAVKPCAPWPC